MNEIIKIAASFFAGATLGTIFFGGLWLTVKKAMASTAPGLWFAGSFLIRISIALVGFYIISNGDWKKLLACLLGFLVARMIVIRFTKSIKNVNLKMIKEVKDEA